EDRIAVGRRLAEAWPRRGPGPRRAEVYARASRVVGQAEPRVARKPNSTPTAPAPDEPDWLHADHFSSPAPLLAVHLGAGNSSQPWPSRSWKALVERFLEDGWRIIVVGGVDDLSLSNILPVHDRLRDWAGSLTVAQTTALLERADLFIGADSGPAHLAASAG